jgi:Trypsin-co-occurring domain 2
MADSEDGVGLADALETLRSELASARLKAAGTDLQFPIETLTVELKTVVTRNVDGKAGFKVPFVNAELGGSAGRGSELVQTLTLVLGPPVDSTGHQVKVGTRWARGAVGDASSGRYGRECPPSDAPCRQLRRRAHGWNDARTAETSHPQPVQQ